MAAYKFFLNDTLGDGFRRIAAEQIALARRSLNEQPGKAAKADKHQAAASSKHKPAPPKSAKGVAPEQIHKARKSLKRLRALLTLCRKGLGEEDYSHENSATRDTARLLSGARDADVMLETLTALEAHFNLGAKGPTTSLRRLLVAHQRKHRKTSEETSFSQAREALELLGERLATIDIGGKTKRILRLGLKTAYGRGHRQFKMACRSRHDEDFHDCRKHVQRHWRHMMLLEDAWPAEFLARASLAKDVAQLLGNDHDLSLLTTFINENGKAISQEDRRALHDMAAQRQRELRDLVEPLGKQLFCEAPDNLSKRLIAYWRFAQGPKL